MACPDAVDFAKPGAIELAQLLYLDRLKAGILDERPECNYTTETRVAYSTTEITGVGTAWFINADGAEIGPTGAGWRSDGPYVSGRPGNCFGINLTFINNGLTQQRTAIGCPNGARPTYSDWVTTGEVVMSFGTVATGPECPGGK